MRYQPSLRRRFLTLISSLGALSLLGCSGGNEVPLFPAQGKLTVAGLPAEGALITLIPDGAAELDVRPAGRVDAEGIFSIQTYDPDTQTTKEGARPGAYIALVTWVPDPTDSNLEMGVRDRLGNRYRNREGSKFRFEIKEGAPELTPIDLPKSDLAY